MYLFALTNCLYVFTIGYIFKSSRKLISNLCELFGYQKFKEAMHPEIKRTLPEVGITDLADDDMPIRVRQAYWMDGNISLAELIAIIKLIEQYKPKRIFEIGTFDGRTTLNLAANSQQDALIYTLDLPKRGGLFDKLSALAQDKSFVNKVNTGCRFHGTDIEKKIIQLFGDSATFDFSPYWNSMDFVFVDGAHTNDYVLSDTEKALKLLRDGRGVIVWHDYSWVWEDVTKALNRLQATEPRLKNIKHIKGTSLVCYISAISSREQPH